MAQQLPALDSASAFIYLFVLCLGEDPFSDHVPFLGHLVLAACGNIFLFCCAVVVNIS